MQERHNKYSLAVALALSVGLTAISVQAQVTGELVDPNIMLLIDSSASMDWAEGAPSGTSNYDWAREQCERTNAGDTFEKTAWQKVLDSLLGGIDGDTRKCAEEPPILRPALHGLDEASLADYLSDSNGDGIPDNLSEFRQVSWSHYRALSCPNPSDNWTQNSAGYYQCIANTTATGVTINGFGTVPCLTDDISDPYDGINYCLNYHPEAENRQSNGILDRYETMARFGFMTFDNYPSCFGDAACADPHARLWDYGVFRNWDCKDEGETDSHLCFDWNAGARGPDTGAAGGMVGISSNVLESNLAVRNALETMEPLNCSPVGALLDDVGHYLRTNAEVLPASASGIDNYYRCRPKVTILISDGQPTQAFEFTAGGCGDEDAWTNASNALYGDDAYDGITELDPVSDYTFSCPWRSSPEEAWETFKAGMDPMISDFDASKDIPHLLVVIGFNVPDVDCAVTPEECYEYTAEYYLTKRCYEDLPPCGSGAGSDAGVDGGAAIGVDAGAEVCLMNPREFLNEIACQGWPYQPEVGINSYETTIQPPWLVDDADICGDDPTDPDKFICLEGERALFVNNSSKLAAALDLVIGVLASNVATRTDVVHYNIPLGVQTDDTAAQYEFRTEYVARSGEAWQGVLARKDWNCIDQDSDTASNVKNVADDLLDQPLRNFYSIDVDIINDDNPDLKRLDLATIGDFMSSGIDVDALGGPFDDCDFGVADDVGPVLCSANTTVRNEVLDQMQNRGLADIFNSTPDVLGPPMAFIPVLSYGYYKLDQRGRSTYLFVGTNDGVLHAFNVDSMTTGANVEEWGYVPRSLLKLIRNQYPLPDLKIESGSYSFASDEGGLHQHLFLLDGSPVARDVLLARNLDDLASEDESQWAAMVFGGFGRGARGYYALDVTKNLNDSSEKPRVRWEISPDDDMWGYNDSDDDPTDEDEPVDHLKKMGYPLSRPALAYVRYKQSDDSYPHVAAAVLPGGWNSDSSPNGNTGVYIVQLGNGKVIKYLDPVNDVCSNSEGLTTADSATPGEEDLVESAQLIGEPVILNDTTGLRLAKQILIGDDRGRLWMIDLQKGQADPDSWCLNLYFDTMIAWHYPYADCVPRNANPLLDPVTTTDPDVWCDPADTPNCYHEDCCVGGADGATVLKCGADYRAPRNMNGARVMLIGPPGTAWNDIGEPVIVFGTGQYDGLSRWNRNRVFSLTDKVENAGTEDELHKPVINWWIGDPVVDLDYTSDTDVGELEDSYANWLNAIETRMSVTHVHTAGNTYPDNPSASPPLYFWNVGEKMIGRPIIFDELVYFTTFVPIENPLAEDMCEAGTSRIWSVHYNYDKATDIYNWFDNYYDTNFGWRLASTGERIMYDEYPGDLLSGVQIVRRPKCDGVDQDVFRIVVQKAARAGSEIPTGSAPPPDTVAVENIRILKNASPTVSQVSFDSWSLVFE